jgi:cysteine desulfurase
MTSRIYLDWNATAPLRPQARAAMLSVLEAVGNPSSIHAEGRIARRLIEQAREQVAALFGADVSRVTFTSGGTEANMLALVPENAADTRQLLLVSAAEHPSVRGGGRFPADSVEQIPITDRGQVDLTALDHRMALAKRRGDRPLVSIMLANNETGIVQPVAAAAPIVREAGGRMHVDAVQAAGRIPCHLRELGADLVTVSGHKLGGPKGVGALIRADARPTEPLIKGGGQEGGMRAGTENVMGIVGFGAACVAANEALIEEYPQMRALRDRLEQGLRDFTPDVVIFGAEVERLPNTTLFAVPGLKAETAVIAFDLDGIAVSSGAACSSGKVQPSHVLAAMGVAPPLARGAVRVSLGWTTTESEVERFLSAWKRLSQSLLRDRRYNAAEAA